MICQVCRNAQAVMSKFMPQKGMVLRVCETCMSDRQLSSGASFNTQVVQSISSTVAIQNDLNKKSNDLKFDFVNYYGNDKITRIIMCHECGIDYEDFKKIKRLGCSHCYKSFERELAPIVRGIHGGTKHNGSRPNKGGK